VPRTLTLTLGNQRVNFSPGGIEATLELGALALGIQTLTIQAMPTTATDATAFPVAPVVYADNGFGQPVAGVTVTAAIASGTGALVGTVTAVTYASGLATFSTIGIDDSTL